MVDASVASPVVPAFAVTEVVPELRLILEEAFSGGVFLNLQADLVSKGDFTN